MSGYLDLTDEDDGQLFVVPRGSTRASGASPVMLQAGRPDIKAFERRTPVSACPEKECGRPMDPILSTSELSSLPRPVARDEADDHTADHKDGDAEAQNPTEDS